MTRVEVRPLTDGDDVDALDEGDPLAWMTAWWRSIPELPFQWFVGLLDGEPVGVAAGCPRPMAAGGTGFALLNVVPSARRQGVGTELRRVLEDSVRGLVPGLVYSYLEGDPTAEAAVRAWGLTEMGRHHESVLDLSAVDRDLLRRKATLDGIDLAPLGAFEEMTDADWAELHGFVQARFREAPDTADGGGELPFEVFRSRLHEPWMLHTARADGVLVGITFVTARPGRGDATNTFFTGVHPDARGCGIATALKAAQALDFVDHGVQAIYTQNMDGNEPILAANRSLGFQRDSGYVEVLATTT
jgi:GNAT superfamily N-acetyltransferase